MNAIFERKSVRRYTDAPVGDEEVRDVLRAAMAAPSAHNQQPWEFYVVRDAERRAALSKVSQWAGPAGLAPVVIAACIRAGELPAEPFAAQDMGACVENLLVEAADKGLGAVWMGMYPVEERVAAVADIVGAPDGVRPFALIALGHPDPKAEGEAQGPKRYDEARVHWLS